MSLLQQSIINVITREDSSIRGGLFIGGKKIALPFGKNQRIHTKKKEILLLIT